VLVAECLPDTLQRHLSLPHSSSASCFTAGAAAFFNLSQSGERPEWQPSGKRGENAEAVAKELLLKRTSGLRNDFDRPIAAKNYAQRKKPHSTEGLRTKGNPNTVQLQSRLCQLNAALLRTD